MPPEPMPEGASAKADKGQGRKPTKPKADIWDAHDRYGVWTRSDVGDLGDVFEGREPDDDPWNRMWENADVRYAVGGGDSSEIWEAVQEWLIDNDYPTRAITQLEDVLTAEGIIGGAPSRKDAQVIDMIEEPTGNGFLTGF